MSDETHYTLRVRSTNPEIITAASDMFDNMLGISEDDNEDGYLCVSAYDVSAGHLDDLTAQLATIRDTHGEFAYAVNDTPYAEWLGTVHYYVPGHEKFDASCDDDGDPYIPAGKIDEVMNSAADPESIMTALADVTGKTVREAFDAYDG